MARFSCHTCKLYRRIKLGGRTPSPGSIRCLRCNDSIFWVPKAATLGPEYALSGAGQPSPPHPQPQPIPVAVAEGPALQPPSDNDPDARAEIADMWTPGEVGDAFGNAMSHWSRHSSVNNVHHASCLSYVRAAASFYAQHRANRVPQAKNPSVEYVHNCAKGSASATLLVVNIEPGERKYRFASFYDMTPGRSNKSIQQQLADQTGLDEHTLFG